MATRKKAEKSTTKETKRTVKVSASKADPFPKIVRTPVTTKPSMPSQERRREVMGVVNKLNAKFKRPMLNLADDMVNMHHIRRPSGILQLDIDCGGGFQAGTFNTITGPDNVGKSTLLYKYCAMHQRLYGNDACIAFHPAEDGGIDYWRARRMGWVVAVPKTLIEASQQRRHRLGLPLLTDEEVADLRTGIGQNVQIAPGTQEEVLLAVEELLRQNIYGIIWIDSLEAMIPDAEAQLDSLEDNPMQAAHARNLTRFFQRYAPITHNQMAPGITTLIGTCQVRANRKKAEVQSYLAKYMPDYTGTNVRSVKHWRQIDITLKPGEKIKDSKTKEQIGKGIRWEITKGKGDTHDGITGEVSFYYDEPTHTRDLEDIIVTGLRYGAIVERNGMLTLINNVGTSVAKPDELLEEVPNKEMFIEEMAKDFEVELRVREQILHAAGKHCSYR